MKRGGRRAPVAVPARAPVPSSWIFPLPLVGIGITLWGLIVFFCYFGRFPFPLQTLEWMTDQIQDIHFFHAYMFKALWGATVALALAGLGAVGGARLLMRTGLPFSRDERLGLGSMLGVAVLAFGTWGLGAIHLWYPGVFAGAAAAWAIYLGLTHRRPVVTVDGNTVPVAPWFRVWSGLLIAVMVIIAVGDLTPEVFYDSLYYHIAVPNLYAIAHRVYNIPTLLFSNFVLTLQFLYGLGMTLGNELTAKWLHGLLAGLLIVAGRMFEGRYLSPGAGLLGAVIFLTAPLVGMNAFTTGSDVAWSTLQVMAAYAMIRALMEPEPKAWMLAGVLTGLSAGCKYPGLPFIPLAGALILWHERRPEAKPWNVIAKELSWFFGGAAMMILPLLTRNILFHGNPLYPFGGTQWGHPRIDPHYWHIFVVDANARGLAGEFASWDSALRFILHPWFITMNGQSNGDFVGPLYLLLLPLIFLFRAPSRGFRILRSYAGLLWVVWLFTSNTPRYGLPALALAAFALAECAVQGFKSSRWRAVVFGLITLGAVNNLAYLSVVLLRFDGWRVLTGQVDANAYLNEMHASYPTPPYLGLIWMNEHLPPDAKILIAGEARTFYTKRLVVPSSVPDPQPLIEFSSQSSSGADMAERIRAEHITHIFLNFAEAVRTEGYGLFPWTPASWAVFQDFWTHSVVLVWKQERSDRQNPQMQYVYQILSEADSAQPHAVPPNPFERWRPK